MAMETPIDIARLRGRALLGGRVVREVAGLVRHEASVVSVSGGSHKNLRKPEEYHRITRGKP